MEGSALVATDDPAMRDAATLGLLDYYLHTAAAATTHLEPPLARTGLDFGVPSRHIQLLPSHVEAEAWLEAEWQNVVTAIRLADNLGCHRHTWQTARALWIFLWRRGHHETVVDTQKRALLAAGSLNDTLAMATSRNYLASGHLRQGRPVEAYDHLRVALAGLRGLDDSTAQL